MTYLDTKTIERFWSKVDRSAGTDGCWLWMAGRKGKMQYGRFVVQKPLELMAHVVAFEVETGCEKPAGLCVCHHCDNPICCNPSHLFLGTQKENIQDCISKGRFSFNRPPGRSPVCGEYGRYRLGCRCKECRRANCDRMTKYYRARRQLDRQSDYESEHGVSSSLTAPANPAPPAEPGQRLLSAGSEVESLGGAPIQTVSW